MPDKEIIIKGLECCLSTRPCEECPYNNVGTKDNHYDCEYLLKLNALSLLKSEQETPQPVREATSDFVRFNQGEMICIINRRHITDAVYYPGNGQTWIKIEGTNGITKIDGNIIDKITGGE